MNETTIKQLVSLFLKQNILFRTLHTSSSAVHIKSILDIQIIRGLLECYSIVKNTFKNFYLTVFIAIMNKTIKTFYISY